MSLREAARVASKALAEAGIEDSQLESELLARHAAGIDRATYFSTEFDDERTMHRFACAVERRINREPAAYITGTREFYGLAFRVGKGVLIPRPETELLVELVLREVEARPGATVADIGTGSGCIAVAVKVHAPMARVLAVDRSTVAVSRATRNARRHRADVSFVVGDLANGIGGADVVVANLPYIPTSTVEELEPEVRAWEPRGALDGGGDGLELIRLLVDDCGARLRPRFLALEVGAGQARAVEALCESAGARETGIVPDLAGIERVVTARWG
ncbi:MAG: peptide chain release factor N(5)-glutamine methyltransferase [Tepidiformaceae bacterium]